MESQSRDEGSDEDIPSDFFDDFNKDEFMEGLSVIDSWDVKEVTQRRSSRSRIDAAAVDGVRDLRELIRDGRDEMDPRHLDKYKSSRLERDTSYERHYNVDRRDSNSRQLDNYIKPGSRRDLRKTNEAIRRDKQVKVKEYLSKHLDSMDDLKPPGTELDDFLNEHDTNPIKRNKSNSPEVQYTQYSNSRRAKHRESPRRVCPQRGRRSGYSSPQRGRHSGYSSPQYHHHNTQRHSPHYSPYSKFPHHSPSWRMKRHSSPEYNSRQRSRPRRSTAQGSSSRHSHSSHSRGRSRSPEKYFYIDKHSSEIKNNFLYPNKTCQTLSQALVPANAVPYQSAPGNFYLNPPVTEYPIGYSYMQGTPYTCASYDYGAQTQSMNYGLVQPASTPIMNLAPTMVPPPSESTPAIPEAPITMILPRPQEKPQDALAKLVVEGKISKEDYLKLAPNKSTIVDKAVDTGVRLKVFNRCLEAFTKLTKLDMPNRLLLNSSTSTLIAQETKSLAPKYCSPLKRQATVEFYFSQTSTTSDTVQQNRQVIDSIIAAIGLTDVVSRSKMKSCEGMKDAAVQTTKPYCEVCQIRDATKTYEAQTSVELDHFTATVHTQVVDQDLIVSKSVFTPSGGVPDGDPISIAHLTPAQLVSQLAARARTLKQTQEVQPPQFSRWTPGKHHDYGARRNADDMFPNNYSYH